MPNLQLEERPLLDLTDAEITALDKAYPVATGKILKYCARWWEYADVAEAAVKGYRDYIESVFTPGKKGAEATPAQSHP